MTQPQRNPEIDIANFEDIASLKAMYEKPALTNADIRQSSGLVRRLLIYREILLSSAPRFISIKVPAPDTKVLIRAANNGYVEFFQSGGVQAFGVQFTAMMLGRGNPTLFYEATKGFKPTSLIELKLESFLKQQVFFFNHTFISRNTVLCYVANKAAGVHFDDIRGGDFDLLTGIRSAVSIKMDDDGIPSFGLDMRRLLEPSNEFVWTSNSLDAVFLELVAAVRFLIESHSIYGLMAAIAEDYSLPFNWVSPPVIQPSFS